MGARLAPGLRSGEAGRLRPGAAVINFVPAAVPALLTLASVGPDPLLIQAGSQPCSPPHNYTLTSGELLPRPALSVFHSALKC